MFSSSNLFVAGHATPRRYEIAHSIQAALDPQAPVLQVLANYLGVAQVDDRFGPEATSNTRDRKHEVALLRADCLADKAQVRSARTWEKTGPDYAACV